jgi:phosphatidylserine/phosphatidylglycerophosphate/cardiolipin synthase-like enzyme
MTAWLLNRSRGQSTLITGLFYGVGLALGNLVSNVLFRLFDRFFFANIPAESRLLIGLIMVIIILALGGGIAGFSGGWTLPVIGKPKGKWGYAWRSAISFGIAYSTSLFLLVFVLSLMTAADAPFMSPVEYGTTFVFAGVIFALLFGLIQGSTTVGIRRTGSVLIASVVGFGIGGFLLGVAVWAYLLSAPIGGIDEGTHLYLVLGLFAFGLFGGLGVGFAYQRLAARAEEGVTTKLSNRSRLIAYCAAAFILVLFISLLKPVLKTVGGILTPRSARLEEVIKSNTVGTQWDYQESGAHSLEAIASLDLATGSSDMVALTWAQGAEENSNILFQQGTTDLSTGDTSWLDPIAITDESKGSRDPQVVMAPNGEAIVFWVEGGSGERSTLNFSTCDGGACSTPQQVLSPGDDCIVNGFVPSDDHFTTLDAAVNSDGALMVIWRDDAGGLRYLHNSTTELLSQGEPGCVPVPHETVGTFSLQPGPGTDFSLALDSGSEGESIVTLWQFHQGGWGEDPGMLGEGYLPQLRVDESSQTQVAWCSEDDGVQFWDGEITKISESQCKGPPMIARDGLDRLHTLWYTTEVTDALGGTRDVDVLVESIQTDVGWSSPSIVAELAGPGDYEMIEDDLGALKMAWLQGAPGESVIDFASQVQYVCDDSSLTGIEKAVFDVARTGGYRPDSDIIPFCSNQYEMMIFTPNVSPEFSDREPTTNGAYDDYVDLLKEAEYEVLFTTMAYKEAKNHDSPGAVLADGVYELYQKVKENPEDYPRGMHVRLLLGNSPPITEMEVDGQIWLMLKDLQEAGFEKLNDPEVGWKLEVGNYGGAWPHSHVKTMIVDGETMVASGFNHEYKPLPKDHYSGQGLGDADTGIIMNGPIAQQTRRIYEEVWEDATVRNCDDLTINRNLWRFTCEDSKGVSTDIAEAMRFAPTEEDTVAFSMFRNKAYDESDQQLVAAFESATESVDIAQAMFSMPLYCNLNYFFDVCTFLQAPPYLRALMKAAENGAEVRVLLTPYPIQNVENNIAMEIFNAEAVRLGVDDHVELRWFDDLLHSKSALIDEEFLIIGSQNLHHSAFGEGTGLSEYNIGTSDPDAIKQFQQMYEYFWERVEELTANFD